MNNNFRLYLVGLVISAAVSFIGGELIPWVAGGLGIVMGVLIVAQGGPDSRIPGFLLAAVGFMLALYLIENQYYNPEWLSRVALFGRVYVSHALLFPALFEARQRLGDL